MSLVTASKGRSLAAQAVRGASSCLSHQSSLMLKAITAARR